MQGLKSMEFHHNSKAITWVVLFIVAPCWPFHLTMGRMERLSTVRLFWLFSHLNIASGPRLDQVQEFWFLCKVTKRRKNSEWANCDGIEGEENVVRTWAGEQLAAKSTYNHMYVRALKQAADKQIPSCAYGARVGGYIGMRVCFKDRRVCARRPGWGRVPRTLINANGMEWVRGKSISGFLSTLLHSISSFKL